MAKKKILKNSLAKIYNLLGIPRSKILRKLKSKNYLKYNKKRV